jgi:hypothetical protein
VRTARRVAATAATSAAAQGQRRGAEGWRSDASERAATKSSTVSNRSAGTFDRARSTAISIESERLGRTMESEGGRSLRWRAMTAHAVRPVKGGSPESMVYRTHANEY